MKTIIVILSIFSANLSWAMTDIESLIQKNFPALISKNLEIYGLSSYLQISSSPIKVRESLVPAWMVAARLHKVPPNRYSVFTEINESGTSNVWSLYCVVEVTPGQNEMHLYYDWSLIGYKGNGCILKSKSFNSQHELFPLSRRFFPRSIIQQSLL